MASSSGLDWAGRCCLLTRSLSSTPRNPHSEGDRVGHGHPHTGGISRDPEEEKGLEGEGSQRSSRRRASGWASRLVGNRVEVGLSPVGTKSHRKLAAGAKRERSAGTTWHQPEGFLEEENSWNWAVRMPDGPSRELPQQQERQSPDRLDTFPVPGCCLWGSAFKILSFVKQRAKWEMMKKMIK